MTFAEKSLKPTAEDSLKLRPVFNNFEVRRSTWNARLAAQLDLKCIVRKLNSTLEQANVDKFCEKLIPVMNKAFAFVKGRPKAVIAEKSDNGYLERSIASTMSMFNPYFTFCIYEGEKKRTVHALKVWRGSRNALQYNDVGFNPRPYSHADCASPSMLNTFTGLRLSPIEIYSGEQLNEIAQNEMKPFLEHVFKIWCDSDQERYKYVIQWLFTLITMPWVHVETALVLKSDDHRAKLVIVRKIIEVLGAQHVFEPDSLNLRNNVGFKRCLLLILEEELYARSKAKRLKVKHMISD